MCHYSPSFLRLKIHTIASLSGLFQWVTINLSVNYCLKIATLLLINWFFKKDDMNNHGRLKTWTHPEPSILHACIECPELDMTNFVVWVSLDKVYHIVLHPATLWIPRLIKAGRIIYNFCTEFASKQDYYTDHP